VHPRVDRRNWSLVCFKKNHWSIIRDASTKRVWIISNQLAVEMRHSPVQCKCIGDNCLPKRRSLLVVYIQFGYSADTVACNTFVDRVGAGAQAVAENEASRGFWPDVWPHGILTNISWTRTVAGAFVVYAHRLATTRIWPISPQAWPFVLHCLAWNGLALLSCFYISIYTIGFLWLAMQSPAGTNELLISW